MFRSLSRITVATALVLAFLLSTVPAQAQPRDLGSSFSLDTSWLDAALGWLVGVLGGDSEEVQTRTTDGKKKDDGGGVTVRTGPCIDPFGCPGGEPHRHEVGQPLAAPTPRLFPSCPILQRYGK